MRLRMPTVKRSESPPCSDAALELVAPSREPDVVRIPTLTLAMVSVVAIVVTRVPSRFRKTKNNPDVVVSAVPGFTGPASTSRAPHVPGLFVPKLGVHDWKPTYHWLSDAR